MSAEEAPDLTYAALAATMELTKLRSMLRVGTALVSRFPQDEDWWALISQPDFVASLNTLAEVVNDIRGDTSALENPTPEGVAECAERHYSRAVEAIELVASELGVPADDLLSVLVDV
jgi:hypothetical protein